MILSNRKLKLIIISLLLLIFSYFIGIFNVKADDIGAISSVTSYSMFGAENFNVNQWGAGVSGGSGTWANWGKGYLIFSVATYCKHQETPGASCASYVSNMLTGININVDSKNYTCDIGNSNSYFNNGDSVNTYSAKCLIDRTSNGKFTIGFSYPYSPSNFTIRFSDNITFVQITSSTSTITDAISSNSQAERTLLTNIINSLNAGNTNVEDAIKEGNQNTEDIKNAINDDSVDSSGASSSASTWNSKNATNGVITQLLTLPISLLQAIVNGIQTSCSSFSLGSLFGTNITLPCINISNLIGSGLFTTIDILFSGFMILSISKKMIKIFNDFTNLKSNQIDELYGGGN